MPTEFLLPAFALTLLANAVLVAAAMRALWGGRRGPDGDRPWIGRSTSTPTPMTTPAASPPATETQTHGLPTTDVPQTDPSVDPPVDPAAHVPDSAAAPTPRRKATVRRGGSVAERAKRPAAGSGRGRRRFSLPPLDEDHEKVSRSIESFLSSGDVAGDPPDAVAGDGQPVSQTARPSASTGATTVALVAVDGVGEPGDDALLDTLERTLRATARGTDIVTGGKRGRYRIVLKGTGELAARAYLRRFRAAIEPVLAEADGRLRLRVATATILGAPLRTAVELAERRLAALAEIRAQPEVSATRSGAVANATDESNDLDEFDDEIEPRAAGD